MDYTETYTAPLNFIRDDLRQEHQKYCQTPPPRFDVWKMIHTVKKIREHLQISHGTVATLEYFASNMSKQSWKGQPVCWASVDTIALQRGISTSSVNSHMRELERVGIGVRTTLRRRSGDTPIKDGMSLAPIYYRREIFTQILERKNALVSQIKSFKTQIKQIRWACSDLLDTMTHLESIDYQATEDRPSAVMIMDMWRSLPRRLGNKALDELRNTHHTCTTVLDYMRDIISCYMDNNLKSNDLSPVFKQQYDSTNISNSCFCNPDMDGASADFNQEAANAATSQRKGREGNDDEQKATTVAVEKQCLGIIQEAAPDDWVQMIESVTSYGQKHGFARVKKSLRWRAAEKAINLGISHAAIASADNILSDIEFFAAVFTVDAKYRLQLIESPGGYFSGMIKNAEIGSFDIRKSLRRFIDTPVPNIVKSSPEFELPF